MSRDTNDVGAEIARSLEIVARADSGQQQHGELRPRQHRARSLYQLEFVDQRRSVLNRGAAKAVAVRDFNHVDAGGVERACDRANLLGGELVPDHMRAIAERHVADSKLIHREPPAAPERIKFRAASSPTRTAAAV